MTDQEFHILNERLDNLILEVSMQVIELISLSEHKKSSI